MRTGESVQSDKPRKIEDIRTTNTNKKQSLTDQDI